MEQIPRDHEKPTLEAFWNEISQRAKEIYEKRVKANKPGDELSDWYQAEKEVRKRHES